MSITGSASGTVYTTRTTRQRKKTGAVKRPAQPVTGQRLPSIHPFQKVLLALGGIGSGLMILKKGAWAQIGKLLRSDSFTALKNKVNQQAGRMNARMGLTPKTPARSATRASDAPAAMIAKPLKITPQPPPVKSITAEGLPEAASMQAAVRETMPLAENTPASTPLIRVDSEKEALPELAAASPVLQKTIQDVAEDQSAQWEPLVKFLPRSYQRQARKFRGELNLLMSKTLTPEEIATELERRCTQKQKAKLAVWSPENLGLLKYILPENAQKALQILSEKCQATEGSRSVHHRLN